MHCDGKIINIIQYNLRLTSLFSVRLRVLFKANFFFVKAREHDLDHPLLVKAETIVFAKALKRTMS